jgi:hypothetical protein
MSVKLTVTSFIRQGFKTPVSQLKSSLEDSISNPVFKSLEFSPHPIRQSFTVAPNPSPPQRSPLLQGYRVYTSVGKLGGPALDPP